MSTSRTVYPPLDVLKPVAPDVWIVDSGPLHSMGLAIPVRMTVVRLKSGDLWLHSPTRYDEGLGSELHRIGTVRPMGCSGRASGIGAIVTDRTTWSF